MPGKLPQLKPKELIRVLEKLGFVFRRQTGSHCILKHPENGKVLAVPMHAGDIKRGLLFGIIKQAGLSQEDFLELLK